MRSPENLLSIEELLKQVESDDTYNARLVGRGLQEVYRSGKYATLFIPVGSPTGGRMIEAVHLAAIDANKTINLLEFIPNTSTERQEVLERQLRAQLAAFDPLGDITDDLIKQAPYVLAEQGLHVFGAFQLGILGDGQRSTEIIFPRVFAQLTQSNALAATLSAAFVRYAQ